MSNTDLPNNNFYDQEQTQNKQVTEMLSQFMNPSMAGWLSSIIQGGLRNFVLSDAVGMPGFNFGQAALFGPTNAAHEMYARVQQQGLTQLQNAVTAKDNQALLNLRDTTNRLLYPSLGAEELARKNMGFNIPNMMSDWLLYNATGARDFDRYNKQTAMLAGYATAMPDMGAGVNSFLERQRNYITGAMGATTAMQRSNILYGVSGGDLGKLRMEMARTGMMGVVPGMSQQDYTKNVMSTFDAWASTVEPLREFFGNDINAGMDQLSGLLGVSALPTFGAEAGNMLRGLRAAGRVLGYSNPQMMTFAAQAAQTAQAYGLDQFGAIEQGRIAATTFRAATSLPGALRYVNEQQLRETVIQRTVGAGGSTLSRIIAGAAVSVDPSKQEDFFTEAGKANTADEVAAIARKYGARGSTNDFLNASRTNAAKDILASGRTSNMVLKRNLRTLEADRRSLLVERFGEDAVAGMANMSVEELANSGLDKPEQGLVQGMWDEQATAAGYKDANALDAVLNTARYKEFVDAFEARIGDLKGRDKDMQGFMRQGLTGAVYNALIAGGGKTFNMMEALTGQSGAERIAIARKFKAEAGDMAAIVNSEEDAKTKALYNKGMKGFLRAILEGKIGDEKFTADDMAEIKQRVAAGEGKAVLAELADRADPRGAYDRKAREMAKTIKGDNLDDDEKLKRAKTIQFLKAFADDKTVEGLGEDADEAVMKAKAKDFMDKLEKGTITQEEMRQLKKYRAGLAGYAAQDETVKNIQGGYITEGPESVAAILTKIFELMQDSIGNQSAEPVKTKETPKKGGTG